MYEQRYLATTLFTEDVSKTLYFLSKLEHLAAQKYSITFSLHEIFESYNWISLKFTWVPNSYYKENYTNNKKNIFMQSILLDLLTR